MKYLFILLFLLTGCNSPPTADQTQTEQQEKILKEATAQTGMPSIINFRERKLLKQIYELRDQKGLITYTYIVAENTGKLIFLGESIGYGIPAATQYTSPSKIEYHGSQSGGNVVIPQADPNGLFSPSSAEGTWIMLYDKEKKEAVPVYVEPRIIVSPFKLD
jgi:hypothetical protein